MLAITLSYIVLLLLIGIHQQNKSIILFTYGYFILVLLLSPYLKESQGLELIAIALLLLILQFTKSKEPFQNELPTRDCKIYFTNYTEACDNNEFTQSEVELQNKINIAKREADSYRSINPRLYNTVMSWSYKVSKPEATFYEHTNYGGRSWTLKEGDYPWVPNQGIPNDSISSIKVGPDTRIYIYEHGTYGGRVQDFVGPYNVPELLSYRFNDIISSIKITYHPIAYYKYLLTIQQERRRLNNQCKQEFPEWKEIASHPVKKPSELINRGNLRDWGFCYRELFDRNSGNTYNQDLVASKFEELRASFGKHSLVEPDDEYVALPDNIGKTYNRATPEFIRIYFKNLSPSPSATCENPAVDYKPSYPSLTPQYGFEFGIRSPSTNNYILNSLSIIRTGSPVNGYSFMYEGRYNQPDPSAFLNLLFDYKLEGNRIIAQPKADVAANNEFMIYRMFFDICNKLTYIGTPDKVTYSFSSKIGAMPLQQRVLYQGNYPFNQVEKYSGININAYDVNIINEQTQKLLQKIQVNLSSIQQEQTNANLLSADNPDSQEGFVKHVYRIPNDTKIKNREEMDRLETTYEMMKASKIEYRWSKMLEPDVVWSYHPDLRIKPYGTVNYSTLQVFSGYLRIKTLGQYMFRFLLFDTSTWQGIENAPVPLQYSIDMLVNDQVVSSLYYCSKYDECLAVRSSRDCNPNVLCRPTVPSWYEHDQDRNQSHHIIGTLNITQNINSIKVRIVTNQNVNENPICRLMYKRVSDPQRRFRLMRYYWANYWQRYDDDIIFYKKSEFSPELQTIFNKEKENIEMQLRIDQNNALIQTVQTNSQPVVTSILNNLLNQNASWLNVTNIQKYLSENNRLYVFFKTPRYASILSDTQEKQKIQEFNQSIKN